MVDSIAVDLDGLVLKTSEKNPFELGAVLGEEQLTVSVVFDST